MKYSSQWINKGSRINKLDCSILVVILSQSSGTLLDKLARGIGQTPDLILHSLASGYLKFSLTSLFIGTLNMDGFKGMSNFFETFL